MHPDPVNRINRPEAKRGGEAAPVIAPDDFIVFTHVRSDLRAADG
jgi:hypothetical protein